MTTNSYSIGGWFHGPVWLAPLVARIEPLAQHRGFPWLAAAIAFVATITFTVPMVPVIIGLVLLAPGRWRTIALAAALGSAGAGALFSHYLGHWGTNLIAQQLPQVAASAHWQHLVTWTDAYGLWVLAAYAASPLAQLPALVAFALLGLSGPRCSPRCSSARRSSI